MPKQTFSLSYEQLQEDNRWLPSATNHFGSEHLVNLDISTAERLEKIGAILQAYPPIQQFDELWQFLQQIQHLKKRFAIKDQLTEQEINYLRALISCLNTCSDFLFIFANEYEALLSTTHDSKDVQKLLFAFIYAATYELRTPMLGIKGYVEMIYERESQTDGEGIEENLSKIIESDISQFLESYTNELRLLMG